MGGHMDFRVRCQVYKTQMECRLNNQYFAQIYVYQSFTAAMRLPPRQEYRTQAVTLLQLNC